MSSPPRPRPSVRHVTVGAGAEGQRIDNFLARELKGVPKARIYRAIRRGEVRVNKGRVSQTYRLEPDDVVRIPPIGAAEGSSARPPKPRDWSGAIVHEDKHLLVIDKPAGMAVHGGSGLSHGVIESLRASLPGRPVLELVHRLDRSTSGCLVIAKRRSALRALHEQLREGRVTKEYLLLVLGDWQHGERLVDLPLDVSRRRSGERHVEVAAGGLRAETRFALCESYGDVSLLRATPATGRTHQIRVHAAECGHPLAGDTRYGDPARNAALRRLGLRRLFLHASSIEFEYPAGHVRHFSAPLPDELRAVIDRLDKRGRTPSPRAKARRGRPNKPAGRTRRRQGTE